MTTGVADPSTAIMQSILNYLPYGKTNTTFVDSNGNPLSPVNPDGTWNEQYLQMAFRGLPNAEAYMEFVTSNYLYVNSTGSPQTGVGIIAVQSIGTGQIEFLGSGTQIQNGVAAYVTLSDDMQLALGIPDFQGTPLYNTEQFAAQWMESVAQNYSSDTSFLVGGHSLAGYVMTVATGILAPSDPRFSLNNVTTVSAPGDFGILGTLFNSLTFGAFAPQTGSENFSEGEDVISQGTGISFNPLAYFAGPATLNPISGHLTRDVPTDAMIFDEDQALSEMGINIPITDIGDITSEARDFYVQEVTSASGTEPVFVDFINGTGYLVSQQGGDVMGTGVATISVAEAQAANAGDTSILDSDPYASLAIQEATGVVATRSLPQGTLHLADELEGVGSIIGSDIGNVIANGNPFLQIAVGTLLGAIGEDIGQYLGLDLSQEMQVMGTSAAQSIGEELQGSFNGTLSSVISSQLTNDIMNAIGLHGFGAQLAGVVVNTAISSTIGHALFNSTANINTLYGDNIAAFLGQQLGNLILTPTTEAGEVLGSLGSSIGAFLGSAGGPVGAFLGSFAGDIIGTLIGDLFGKKLPKIPTASADVELSPPVSQYQISGVTSANGGSSNFVVSMAQSAEQTLNDVIDNMVDGTGYVSNSTSLAQGYGYKGNQIYVILGGQQVDVSNATDAVNEGVLWALDQTQVIGGDLFVKRAILNSSATTITQLSADLDVAENYLKYRMNWQSYNQIMAEEPNSAFTAGWIITLQRTNELELNTWAKSDFYGGVQGFLGSFGVGSTNATVNFDQISLSWDGANLTLNGPSGSGLFSILAQSSNNGDSVTVDDFNSVMAGSASVGQDILIADSNDDNITANAVDTWIQGGSGTDVLTGGAGHDVIIAGSGNTTIYGGNATYYGAAVQGSYLAAGSGTDTIYGGDKNDTIVLGTGNDTISAGGGDDTIILSGANVGSGTIDGDTGSNTLSYQRYSEGVNVNLCDWVTPEGTAYTISNIQNLIGAASGGNTLETSSEGGTLEGGTGYDTFIGGGGITTVTFANSYSGVNVNLAANTAYDGSADGDSFENIQNLTGSAYDDQLQGVAGSVLNGGSGGNDAFYYSGGGNTYIGSSSGTATVDYSEAPGALTADLATGTADIEGEAGDTFVDIGTIIGSSHGSNVIGAALGSDFIAGGWQSEFTGSGNDTVELDYGGGTVTVNETRGLSNTLAFGSGVTFDNIWAYESQSIASHSDGSTTWTTLQSNLTFGISDTSDNVTYDGAWDSSDLTIGAWGDSVTHALTNITMNGGATLDISQVDGVIIGSAGTTLNGDGLNSYLIFGNGATVIYAEGSSNTEIGDVIIAGQAGAAGITINTQSGTDQITFERGDGKYTLNGQGGDKTIVFGPTVATSDVIYNVVGDDLYIGLADASDTSLTADQVSDSICIVNGALAAEDQNGNLILDNPYSVQVAGSTIDLSQQQINWVISPIVVTVDDISGLSLVPHSNLNVAVSGSEIVDFSDLKYSDVTLSRTTDSQDLVVTVNSTGATITVQGEFGSTPAQEIEFSDGSVYNQIDVEQSVLYQMSQTGAATIAGFGQHDTLIAGTGDETLSDFGGGNTYIYTSAGGNDVLQETQGNGSIVKLQNISSTDVTLSRPNEDYSHLGGVDGGSDAVLTINSTGKTVTLSNEFSNGNFGEVEFADGVNWSLADMEQMILQSEENSDSPYIYGFSNGNTTFNLGGYDKIVISGEYSNIFNYSSAGGNDVIYGAWGFDTLNMTDIDSTDVTLSRPNEDFGYVGGVDGGNDAVLTINSTGKMLTLANEFSDGDITEINFADGVSWSPAYLQQMILQSEEGSNSAYIYGFSGGDTIFNLGTNDKAVIAGGYNNIFNYGSDGGNDVIHGASGQDTLNLTDIDSTDVTLSRPGEDPTSTYFVSGGNDLVLTINTTGKTLTLSNEFSDEDITQVNFADGVSWSLTDLEQQVLQAEADSNSPYIFGFSGGNTTFNLGVYDKTVISGAYNNVFNYSSAGGNDVIYGSFGQDTLNLTDIDSTDVTLSRPDEDPTSTYFVNGGNDLVFTINSTGKTLTLANEFSDEDITQVNFADGVSWSVTDLEQQVMQTEANSNSPYIFGFSGGNSTFNLGVYDKIAISGSYNNVFNYGSDGGNDVIYGSFGQDTLNLTDINSTGVTLSRPGEDPTSAYYLSGGNDLVITINSTGKTVTLADEFSDEDITQVNFADGVSWSVADLEQQVLQAEENSSSPYIFGFGNGSITFNLGVYNKIVFSGGYNNVFNYSSSGGNDVINGSFGQDTLNLTDIAEGNVWLSPSGTSSQDVDVTILSTGKVLTLSRQLSDTPIQSTTFADGTTWTAQDLQNAATVWGGSDTITISPEVSVVNAAGSSVTTYLPTGLEAFNIVGGQVNVDADNDQISVYGANTTIDVQANGTTLSANNDSINLDNGSAITVNGNENTISQAATFGTIVVNGDSNTLSLAASATALTVTGNNNTVSASGSGDAITIHGTNETLNVSNATIYEGNTSTATINGTGNTVITLDVAPIVFDLAGSGLDLTPVISSNVATNNNGTLMRLGWVGATNGILVTDRAGNGQYNTVQDISFTQDLAGAQTDLEGLAAWDTNGDGVINDQDAGWSQLGIWVDSNGDGIVESGEVKTLAQLGITSISLNRNETESPSTTSINSYYSATSTFTWANGTIGTTYDVSLGEQVLSTSDWLPNVQGTALQSNGGISSLTGAEVNSLTATNDEMIGLQNLNSLQTKTVSDIDPNRGANVTTQRFQVLDLDLTGAGPTTIDASVSGVKEDIDQTGTPYSIGWVGPSDGLLVVDAQGTGNIDVPTEATFQNWVPDGKTSLQGLAAFDTNGDGMIDAGDAVFNNLRIWTDSNGDGVAQPGELESLSQLGIQSISLKATTTYFDNQQLGENEILTTSTVTMDDGTTHTLYDVALGVDTGQTSSTGTTATSPANSTNSYASSALAPTVNASLVAASSTPPSDTIQTPLDNTSTGVTAASAGSVGPSAEILTADIAATPSASGWWDNGAGQNLSDLINRFNNQTSPNSSNETPPSDAIDAAMIQRHLLLRQTIAGFTAQSAAPAVFARQGSLDTQATLASATMPQASAATSVANVAA